MTVLSSAFFSAAVTQGGTSASFGAVVEQLRAESVTGVQDFTSVTSFSTTFTGVYDNATSRVRWTGARIVFDGSPLHPTAYFGRVTEDETMTPGQARTMKFSPVGPLWAVPTATYVAPPGGGSFTDPTGSDAPPSPPPEVTPTVTPFSPRSWGNKPIELHLSFGASPRTMAETKLFQGVTLQKSNRGDIVITGDITCADDSTKYANVPLCYQLPPFGGLTRDAIVRDLASNAGVPAEKVYVPAGSAVTKPILLSNSSLVPFVNELGAPENWFAFFDEDGNFVVAIIALKDQPDWTIDARRGDYDLDQIEETPPTLPPRRYYASGTVPVGNIGTDSTTAMNEITAIYNPLCVKVRPSGAASYSFSDGSYRTLAAPVSMTIGRVETEITTANGRETKRVIKTYGFYNPLRYDPNFDTDPPGSSYDGAYGDRTFHRDEAESLILIKTLTVESEYDINGTLQHQLQTNEGWYAPHRAGNWSSDRQRLSNLAGACFVFPGGTTRTVAEEQYLIVGKIEQLNTFDTDGTLLTTDKKESAWFSPPHWADLVDDGTTPPGPPGPPYVPPPVIDPVVIAKSTFGPYLLGPLSKTGTYRSTPLTYTFRAGAQPNYQITTNPLFVATIASWQLEVVTFKPGADPFSPPVESAPIISTLGPTFTDNPTDMTRDFSITLPLSAQPSYITLVPPGGSAIAYSNQANAKARVTLVGTPYQAPLATLPATGGGADAPDTTYHTPWMYFSMRA